MEKWEREREKARAAELWSVERRGFLAVFYSIGLLTAIPTILSVYGSNHFAEITPSFWQWHQDLSKSRFGIRCIVIFALVSPLYDSFHANLDYALLGRLVIVINNEFRKSSECCKLKKEWLKVQNYNKQYMFLLLSTRNASSGKR